MKIDKDFAVKVEGKVFTGNEIDKIVIDGGKFSMVCTYTNGSKFEVSAYTKDVEFLNVLQIPALAQGGVVTGRDQSHVYYEYSKVGDEPKSDIEMVTPLKKKTFSECAKDAGITFMPCFKSENMEPLAPEETFKKAFKEAMEEMTASMKNAGEQIKNGLESMKKATEPIKVDLSIDGEKFSKLIKDYGKPMARSGR